MMLYKIYFIWLIIRLLEGYGTNSEYYFQNGPALKRIIAPFENSLRSIIEKQNALT